MKPDEQISATAGDVITLTIGSDWNGLASETAIPSATPAPGASTPGASTAASPAPSESPLPGVKTTDASTQTCVEG